MQERDDHQPAFERETLQVLLDVIAADDVEHDVDAALGRYPGDLGREISFSIVDRVISADVAAIRGLVRVADGRDDRRPECLRQLYRAESDAARAAVHEERLALLQPAALEHVVPHGEIVFGQARRFQHRQSARQWQAVRGRRGAVLRVAATRRQCAHDITDAPRIDVLAQRDDRPGDFEPDDRRRIRWRRIASRALQTVGTIDTCVGDANQDVASLGRGHLRFRDSQHFRRSGLAGSDKAHDGG